MGLRCFFWQTGENPRSSLLALPCCGARAVALHRLFHCLDADSARPRFISEAATKDARFFSVVPCTVLLVFRLTRSISDDLFTALSDCAENAKCYRPPSAPYVKDTPGTWTLTVEFANPFLGPGQQGKAVLVLAPETLAARPAMRTPGRASRLAGR